MLYVKVQNGTVLKYPYSFSDLRKDNPQTLFSLKPSAESLVDFNTFIVQPTQSPSYDSKIQMLVNGVELQNNNWVQTWSIENLPQEDAEKNIRNERNGLLIISDWRALNDQTLSPEWQTYRQDLRDITAQAGFPYSVNWPTAPS